MNEELSRTYRVVQDSIWSIYLELNRLRSNESIDDHGSRTLHRLLTAFCDEFDKEMKRANNARPLVDSETPKTVQE